jgi:hypothetical protein
MEDGQNMGLLDGLHEQSEALYIKQEIEQFLGIENKYMPEEIQ